MAQFKVFFGATSVVVTKARAIADTITGLWLSTAASLFDAIDEAVRDDADFIFTYNKDTTKIKLNAVSLGAGSKVLSYTANGDGVTQLTVRLVQGSTVIATQTITPTGTITLYTMTLSGAEVALITDPSNLFLEFQSL